ncbi:MAG: tryptophan-rich sensory protein [Candidatus Altiarchaeota archaeon]|nr:tryptophan-rich sensory protein [Candidatus Altiarchaeota archaeon]
MERTSFKLDDIVKLIACVLVCELAGVVGSIFAISAIPTWYAGLNKPFFTPPNWVFAPVWTALYLLMGVSLYIVWKRGFSGNIARLAFAIQLVLNTLWSVVFFGLKSPPAGVVVIVMLWTAILATIIEFRKTSKTAAALLAPYLLWVSYATLLNISVVLLNP